ncbi:nucleotidyltransferase domain-containing protein [Saccharothrix variisporea]|uniref:Streptomycin 3'-adenylyltransferase n=1 Tax=Saccharothrix variisporea TaxID=543527 RepID=A0A495X7G0_9PSEU|nr:nucleotidyltransferase domain-containing protein [Saccharothrix variisporea]RKT70381.1 streptomycin 3'-adenylyltransferase [Saccharothrix variisporea]
MSDHIALVDKAAPGLVVAAHVVGSTALGDRVPGSDLDLVVELARTPTDDDLRVLAEAQSLDLDVVYLVDGQPGPWGRDGRLNTTPAEVTPVLLEQLNNYSQTLRGPKPHFAVTRDEVEQWCRRNLVEYWAPLVELGAAARGPGLREGVLWLAFGPARLWHTIRTGEIVSKTRAGELAGAHWPDLADALKALVEARHDPGRELREEHRVVAVELGRRVLAEF